VRLLLVTLWLLLLLLLLMLQELLLLEHHHGSDLLLLHEVLGRKVLGRPGPCVEGRKGWMDIRNSFALERGLNFEESLERVLGSRVVFPP